MSIRVALHHHTEYLFDRPVSLAPHVIRLRPAPHVRTPVHHYSLLVRPTDHFINWQQDPFGNYLARCVFPKKARQFAVTVDLVAEMVTINPFDFFVESYADLYPFEYEPQLRKELAPYFEISEDGPRLKEWVAATKPKPERDQIVYFLVDLNLRLQQDIDYVIRMEPGVQSCEETLGLAKGSCRDSAWLLVQILRHLGWRRVSCRAIWCSWLADVKSLDGPSGPEQDFTDLHAWVEVYVPGAGWVGLDPTSGLFAGEGHIPLACTPDPVSAAPITGATDKCEVEFRYENRVTRVHEDPRVTKPYTTSSGSGHGPRRPGRQRLGDGRRASDHGRRANLRVDRRHGRRRVEHRRAGSAQTTSVPRSCCGGCGRVSREGGVLHYGQGKWYPGEPLPRWALACLWRTDGQAVWQDPARLANPTISEGADAAVALRFLQALAGELDIPGDHAEPGFEDGLYYLWKEGTLPDNVDVLDNRLSDPLERKRLRRLFEQGLDTVVGYALPLGWDPVGNRWLSNAWRFRRGHMFLLPGDSPMGLRLPLASLLWEPEAQRQPLLPRDPFAPDEVLPEAFGEVHARYAELVKPPEGASVMPLRWPLIWRAAVRLISSARLCAPSPETACSTYFCRP